MIDGNEGKRMKILVITGSPHQKGTTAVLAEQFIKGAEEAGHDIFRFDAAFHDIHPCIACERCHTTDKGCTFQDDMQELNPKLLEAEAVVFVSPVYYYAINAQIKAVIDRFYANDAALHKNKKTVLMLTMADTPMDSADGTIVSFKGMAQFLGWDIAGIIVGVNCGDVEALNQTEYPNQAYQLGKQICSSDTLF